MTAKLDDGKFIVECDITHMLISWIILSKLPTVGFIILLGDYSIIYCSSSGSVITVYAH